MEPLTLRMPGERFNPDITWPQSNNFVKSKVNPVEYPPATDSLMRYPD